MPQDVSDEELVRQTQADSLEAFEALVYRYERRIYAFVFQACGNAADAREVTQDTFVKAFRALAQFDSRRPFISWLFAIARNKCIDHHRATRAATDEPTDEPTDSDTPALLLSRREEEQNLWQLARRLLPEAQFQALWLRYAEDMEVGQISEVLSKTRTHVKVLLFRARQQLSKNLENQPAAQLPFVTSAQERALPKPPGLPQYRPNL